MFAYSYASSLKLQRLTTICKALTFCTLHRKRTRRKANSIYLGTIVQIPQIFQLFDNKVQHHNVAEEG